MNILYKINKIIIIICLLGYVPLTICAAAAIEGEKEFIETLQARNFFAADTMLHTILQKNSLDAIKTIIEKIFASGDILEPAVYFFQYAVAFNNFKLIKFLLHDKGLTIANLDAYLVKHNRASLVSLSQVLILFEILKKKLQNTVVSRAQTVKMINFLIENGARPDLICRGPDKPFNTQNLLHTALDEAVSSKQYDIAEIFVRNGLKVAKNYSSLKIARSSMEQLPEDQRELLKYVLTEGTIDSQDTISESDDSDAIKTDEDILKIDKSLSKESASHASCKASQDYKLTNSEIWHSIQYLLWDKNEKSNAIDLIKQYFTGPDCLNINKYFVTHQSSDALPKRKKTLFYLANDYADLDIIRCLVEECHLDVNSTDPLIILPLLDAVDIFCDITENPNKKKKILAIIDYLIRHSADVNALTYDNKYNKNISPLILALEFEKYELAKILIEHGAQLTNDQFKQLGVCTREISGKIISKKAQRIQRHYKSMRQQYISMVKLQSDQPAQQIPQALSTHATVVESAPPATDADTKKKNKLLPPADLPMDGTATAQKLQAKEDAQLACAINKSRKQHYEYHYSPGAGSSASFLAQIENEQQMIRKQEANEAPSDSPHTQNLNRMKNQLTVAIKNNVNKRRIQTLLDNIEQKLKELKKLDISDAGIINVDIDGENLLTHAIKTSVKNGQEGSKGKNIFFALQSHLNNCKSNELMDTHNIDLFFNDAKILTQNLLEQPENQSNEHLKIIDRSLGYIMPVESIPQPASSDTKNNAQKSANLITEPLQDADKTPTNTPKANEQTNEQKALSIKSMEQLTLGNLLHQAFIAGDMDRVAILNAMVISPSAKQQYLQEYWSKRIREDQAICIGADCVMCSDGAKGVNKIPNLLLTGFDESAIVSLLKKAQSQGHKQLGERILNSSYGILSNWEKIKNEWQSCEKAQPQTCATLPKQITAKEEYVEAQLVKPQPQKRNIFGQRIDATKEEERDQLFKMITRLCCAKECELCNKDVDSFNFSQNEWRNALRNSLEYLHINFVSKGLKKYPSLIDCINFNDKEKKDILH